MQHRLARGCIGVMQVVECEQRWRQLAETCEESLEFGQHATMGVEGIAGTVAPEPMEHRGVDQLPGGGLRRPGEAPQCGIRDPAVGGHSGALDDQHVRRSQLHSAELLGLTGAVRPPDEQRE